ncbi:MAG: hypothetical protein OXN89_15765 [Bryobacterales bacterium]|nr:hypothetical protein [Bryobacterales bacterium]
MGGEAGTGLAKAALVGLALAVGIRGIGGQVGEEAIAALAPDAPSSHGGHEAGVGMLVQQGPHILVGSTGLGLLDKAGDRGGQGVIARGAGGVEAEQAKAVKTPGVGAGVERAIVVVAAQVGNRA